jgi:transposase InsO family protein
VTQRDVAEAMEGPLAAYVFEYGEPRRHYGTITVHDPRPLPVQTSPERDVGLALSSGGSRVIAFHLGCLRALNAPRHPRPHPSDIRRLGRLGHRCAVGVLARRGLRTLPTAPLKSFCARGLQGAIDRRALLGPMRQKCSRPDSSPAGWPQRRGLRAAGAGSRPEQCDIPRQRRSIPRPRWARHTTETDSCSQHTRAGRRGGHEQHRARSPSVSSGLPNRVSQPHPLSRQHDPPDNGRTTSSCPDNGSAYLSQTHRIARQRLGVRQLRTRPYRPRTNGKAERLIQTLTHRWAYAPAYRSSTERAAALTSWVDHYNFKRPHGSLSHKPPRSRLTKAAGNDN